MFLGLFNFVYSDKTSVHHWWGGEIGEDNHSYVYCAPIAVQNPFFTNALSIYVDMGPLADIVTPEGTYKMLTNIFYLHMNR